MNPPWVAIVPTCQASGCVAVVNVAAAVFSSPLAVKVSEALPSQPGGVVFVGVPRVVFFVVALMVKLQKRVDLWCCFFRNGGVEKNNSGGSICR